MSGVNWVEFLLLPKFRAEFLNGVYESPDNKASFKCDHLARQLRDCAEAAKSGKPYDAKVCEIIGWEQLLCWSRYVAAESFEAVKKCYSGKAMSEREICDPVVLDLHDVVKKHRDAIVVPPLDSALLASCPSLESSKSEAEANASFDCLLNKSGHGDAVKAFAACIKANSNARDACADSHASLMRTLGQIYGKSKLSASFV